MRGLVLVVLGFLHHICNIEDRGQQSAFVSWVVGALFPWVARRDRSPASPGQPALQATIALPLSNKALIDRPRREGL